MSRNDLLIAYYYGKDGWDGLRSIARSFPTRIIAVLRYLGVEDAEIRANLPIPSWAWEEVQE